MLTADTRPALRVSKILYATDFSVIAAKAGQYAKATALRFGSAVEIVHVLPLIEGEFTDPIFAGKWRESKQRLTEEQTLFRNAGIETQFAQSLQHPVSDAVLMLESQCAPDLIIVGTESKSSLDRFLLGSTAEYLIRSANAPVLTIGPNAKQPKSDPMVFETVVLATDFSQISRNAGEYALSLREAGARVLVCNVPSVPERQTHADTVSEETEFWASAKQIASHGTCKPWTPRQQIHPGNAAATILAAAQEVQADLIVMGARARSFLLLHLHRGVTQDVLAQATCPVMTVR